MCICGSYFLHWFAAMKTCRFWKEHKCEMASAVAASAVGLRLAIVPGEDACHVCQQQDVPMAPNHVTASLAISEIAKHSPSRVSSAVEALKHLLARHEPMRLEDVGEGVGSELHEIVKAKGWEIRPGCGCIVMIAMMNNSGADWCWKYRDQVFEVMLFEFHRREPALAMVTPVRAVKWRLTRWLKTAIARWEKK